MSETKKAKTVLAKKTVELREGDFEIIKPRFISLSDEETYLKEISFGMQLIKQSKQLQRCTAESVMESIVNLAQVGLTLNPVLKLAYMVPRYAAGQMKCCIEPSYQGLIKLVTDTGSAKTIYAHVVNEGDDFEVMLGTETTIKHVPRFTSDKFDKVYAVAILHDGTKQVEIMTVDQVKDIRDMSESYKAFIDKKISSCVWAEHFDEMAKKTVIRRLVKYLPKTDLWEKLGRAIEIENEDFKPTDGQLNYIDSLMMTAAITPEELQALELELPTMSASRAGEVITWLKDNQVDAVSAGHNFDMGDITKKIDSHV